MRFSQPGIFRVHWEFESLIFPAGTMIDGKYRLLELLGQGGLGAVYKALDTRLDNIVAVKFMLADKMSDDKSRQRFLREGRILARLQHPYILKIHSLGLMGKEFPFIVTEYVSGESLKQVLDREKRLPVARCLNIAVQVCDAMEAAHTSGVVHRDLTPSNIMLTNGDGADDCVKVIDFGFSFIEGETVAQGLTGTGAIMGSIHFMSPEQAYGNRVDHRADIYALGCVLYRAVTGVPPFDAEAPFELLRKHATEQAPSLSEFIEPAELPHGFERALSRCMAKDCAQRYQSMRELRNDLALIAADDGSTMVQTAGGGLHDSPLVHVWPYLIGAAVVFTIIAVGTIVALRCVHNDGKIDLSCNSAPTAFRRLLDTKLLSKLKPAERVKYLNSWISNNSTDSIDAVKAYYGRAKELSSKSAESEDDLKKAVKIAMRLVDEAIKHHDGELIDQVMDDLFGIQQYRQQPDELIQNLLSIRNRLENNRQHTMDEATFGSQIVHCRCTLAAEYKEISQFDKADAELKWLLNSPETPSIPDFQRLLILANRISYLYNLGNTKETDSVVVEALELEPKVQDACHSKYVLATSLCHARHYKLSYDLCQQEELILLEKGHESAAAIFLPLYYFLHVQGLMNSKRYPEALKIFDKAMNQVPRISQLDLLEYLAKFDAANNVGLSDKVVATLSKIVAEVPSPLEGINLKVVIERVNAIIGPYITAPFHSRLTADRLLHSAWPLSESWRVDRSTVTPVLDFASFYKGEGRTADWETILTSIWKQLDDGSSDFESLYLVYRNLTPSLLSNGQQKRILPMYQRLLRAPVSQAAHSGEIIEARLYYARALIADNNEQQAVPFLEETELLCEKYRRPIKKASCLMLRAGCYQHRSDFSKMMALDEQVIAMPTQHSGGERWQAIGQLGRGYLELGNLVKADQVLNLLGKESVPLVNQKRTIAVYIRICQKHGYKELLQRLLALDKKLDSSIQPEDTCEKQ